MLQGNQERATNALCAGRCQRLYCDDFFFTCEDLGRMFDQSFPAWPLIVKCRLIRAHKFHSLYKGESKVAQRAETTVAESSLTSSA